MVEYEEIGLPAKATVRKTLYCASAGMMLLQLEVRHGHFRLRRLFGKKLADERYWPLMALSEADTHEDPVVCPVSPTLYFISTVLENMPDGHVGGWIRGVFAKDLVSGAVRALVEYPLRQELDEWISGLNGISGDGRTLYCSAAFTEAVADGRRADYFLCTLDASTGALGRLAPLRAVFA